MRNFTLKRFLLSVLIVSAALTSCKDDSYLLAAPPIPDQSFNEELDTLTAAYNRGWRFINKSEPVGTVGWIPSADFDPFSGVGCIESFYDAVDDQGVVNNWAVSQPVKMQNGDKIVFYAMCFTADYADRLQVRINTHNDGLNVGDAYDNPGDFDVVLLDINPTYLADPALGFPEVWTRFEATVYGVSKPTLGRFAFRYLIDDGGASGTNGFAIAVDKVSYIGKK